MPCVTLVLAVIALAFLALPVGIRAVERRRLRQLLAAHRGRLILTFDDGPGERTTPSLLELLSRHHAKATFFPLGHKVKRHARILDRLTEDGHEIGCHSYAHVNAWKALPWRGMTDARAGFDALRQWLPAEGALYRPPFGKLDFLTFVALARKGARIAWWTVDSGDTSRRRPAPEKLERSLVAAGGGVVLLHDFDGTPERSEFLLMTVERLLRLAEEMGWCVCPMGELLGQAESASGSTISDTGRERRQK